MTGADVLEIRTKLGLTQAELAIRLNQIDPALRTYPTTVSRWESGRHDPSPHAAAALRILDRRAEQGATIGPLRASEHLELAAAGFEQDGSVKLAEHLRRIAQSHRDNGDDPLQIATDGTYYQ